ncbi:hypothetical protein BU15DRAFT_77691 [Melanogaster broomeanus]|nr:hypothetical protein BU15DRAFT_77691 [Melanogaster broomeanus]
MFTRFSFSFSRFLRLKSRRASKASAANPGVGASLPRSPPRSPPPPPPKERQSSLNQPPASPATQSLVLQSPQLHPTRCYVIAEKAPSFTSDTVHLVTLDTPRRKRITFVDEGARARADSPTSSSSSSTCYSRPPTPAPIFSVGQVPPKPIPSPLLLHPHAADSEAHQWEDVPESGNGSAFPKPSHKKGSYRPMSLFSPRPTRTKSLRFSVPPLPMSKLEFPQRRASKRESKRDSKRVSMMTLGGGIGASGSVKREKRKSRWSREMERADTQEVLRALRDMH